MAKKLAVRGGVLSVLLLAVITFAACPAKDAANAVNKYADALDALQKAEITLHDNKTVSNDFHVRFQRAIKLAAQSGVNLDQAILIADKGGDPSGYVDVADSSFEQVLALVNPSNQDTLVTLGKVASDALKNAISLVEAIKPQPPAPAPSQPSSGGMALLIAICGGGLFGTVLVSTDGIISLLQAVVQLEPIAFDLIVKLAQSLKGKSVEEITALSDKLFANIEQTADDQIAATETTDPSAPTT